MQNSNFVRSAGLWCIVGGAIAATGAIAGTIPSSVPVTNTKILTNIVKDFHGFDLFHLFIARKLMLFRFHPFFGVDTIQLRLLNALR